MFRYCSLAKIVCLLRAFASHRMFPWGWKPSIPLGSVIRSAFCMLSSHVRPIAATAHREGIVERREPAVEACAGGKT